MICISYDISYMGIRMKYVGNCSVKSVCVSVKFFYSYILIYTSRILYKMYEYHILIFYKR